MLRPATAMLPLDGLCLPPRCSSSSLKPARVCEPGVPGEVKNRERGGWLASSTSE